MNKPQKHSLIAAAIILVIVVVAVLVRTGVFNSRYTVADMISNYNERHAAFNALQAYTDSLVPADYQVKLEFKNAGELNVFNITAPDLRKRNRELEISSKQTADLLKKLGWTRKTLSTLKEKLDSAGCISIESGDPLTVGFRHSGDATYNYKLFRQELSDSTKKEFHDGCRYILFNEHTALEFIPGSIGPDCFESAKK
ncbi:MAG: hypothetical protein INR69_15625 [Mucilaginibacter polytrichastri]|nr:hypothetical protein [Mucilaginibacter polytrichastri]